MLQTSSVSRYEPLRIIALARLVVAGLLFFAGEDLGLGGESRLGFLSITLAYAGVSLLFGTAGLAERYGAKRVATIHFLIDIVALTLIMAVSGGFRSGMPVLMMMFLAAAGLVSDGRIGVFLAAVATLAVLAENLWRLVVGVGSLEFFQVGITCAGFFAIALSTHLLANRARKSEALAQERGDALGVQRAINELIIEDMSDGVVVVAADGTVRQANPRAEYLLGVKLEPGISFATIDSQFLRIRQESPDPKGRVACLGPSQRELRYRVVLARVGDSTEKASDDARDAIVYLSDEEEIKRQVQHLKLASLGRLSANLAHEIRNPLSSIQHAADLLADERDVGRRSRLIDMIDRNGKRIERLIRDILGASRQHAYPEMLPLAAFVAELVEEQNLAAPTRADVLAMEIDVDHAIVFDRAHLHQILNNLIGNARRHASSKPGAIRVFSEVQANNLISVHIVDDGKGIDASRQPHLFEPFLSDDPNGTGLGLYIARELAETNGAQLRFLGNNPGAHFVITGRSQA